MGLINMLTLGINPDVIYAANKVNLNLKKSVARSSVRGLFSINPRDIADLHKIKFIIDSHNSINTVQDIKSRKLDLGIILGARILSKEVINSFNIGIINMHAGILPNNRGLDNVQWAIKDNLPQVVTLHLINEEIDRGKKIYEEEIAIQKDDTLLDIQMKLCGTEQELLRKFLLNINIVSQEWKEKLPSIKEGNYHSILEDSDDYEFEELLNKYLIKWGKN
tara:strand:+ start:1516 stop:2178 length:663 start_codon:yes stop_codon:yes gene_type:complete